MDLFCACELPVEQNYVHSKNHAKIKRLENKA